jgi:FXSXX-COOH protein
MQATDDNKVIISSKMADFRNVPLADMPTLSPLTREALGRVMPGRQTSPVPVAAFQSAI